MTPVYIDIKLPWVPGVFSRLWWDASGPTDLRKDLTETGNHA